MRVFKRYDIISGMFIAECIFIAISSWNNNRQKRCSKENLSMTKQDFMQSTANKYTYTD